MKNLHLGWATLALIGILGAYSVMFHIQGPSSGKSLTPLPGVVVGPDDRLPGAMPSSPSPSASRPVEGHVSTFVGRDKKGHPTWELHATAVHLTDTDKEKRVQADNVQCTFFDERNIPMATVVAPGAVMNMTNQNLFFLGEVNATNPLGDHLMVKKLQYDGKKKKFFGSHGIKMTRSTSVLTGDTMVADPTLKTITVRGHVQAFIHTLAVASPSPSPGVASPPEPPPTGSPQPPAGAKPPPSANPPTPAP